MSRDKNLIQKESIESFNEGYDEDVDSLLAQAHTTRGDSSIRGMSDWDSNAGADSAVDGVPLRQGRNYDIVTLSTADNNGSVPHASTSRLQGITSELRLFRWWSNVVSRVSRSASSLLNQHSPNLNDILDVDEQNPLATTEEVPRKPNSTPENDERCCQNNENTKANNDTIAQENAELREEVDRLKKRIKDLEKSSGYSQTDDFSSCCSENFPSIPPLQRLRPDQITRYSRQLLLNDGFGVTGQIKLGTSSVLVVGAGGLGSSLILYLAAAGIGHITIADYDVVEMSNLHRQIIHKDSCASKTTSDVGVNKAQSAKQSAMSLNPTISCTALENMITGDNALELVSRHDVVIDACDNPRTRYLLNDACILAGKTLVSGSAMGTEGQLTVYNCQNISETGSDSRGISSDKNTKTTTTACYRCMYPNIVSSEGCKSCSDNGVLGPIPGIIGVLQAVEVIKIVTGIGSVMSNCVLMYDSLNCSLLRIRKPPAKHNCAVCSPLATIKSMRDSENSLEHIRGPSVCTSPHRSSINLAKQNKISCAEYNKIRKDRIPHVLLDVRVKRQFEMCSLEDSVNLPLERLAFELNKVEKLSCGELPVFCLCRRGIASAEAARIIQQSIESEDRPGIHSVYSIVGGLESWAKTVDSTFPQY